MYLDSAEYSITIGDTFDTVTWVKDLTGQVTKVTNATFKSDNPAVATIDAQGNITGVSKGSTRITASLNGLQYTATILVVPPYHPTP
ncbi:uncharacterized protein YjdB [Paenibacillus shirakamiensis]|uniref:Uncharacterized protein YjdB n=1 Tax=Paenibacillus shirakamiensis TaxID=1265935 RepID=A0ABS4JK07_9BACL|nr:Ig-like domain-containing protein [Paenibacillus shirakamiensis]MBP2000939.1 uncharacterized protein YjdB [Paenibacillus shirakamiensis]